MAVMDNSPSLPMKELAQYRRDVPTHRGIEELADTPNCGMPPPEPYPSERVNIFQHGAKAPCFYGEIRWLNEKILPIEQLNEKKRHSIPVFLYFFQTFFTFFSRFSANLQ